MCLMHGGIKLKLSFVSLISCLAVIRCYAFLLWERILLRNTDDGDEVHPGCEFIIEQNVDAYIRNRMMCAAFPFVANR